MPFVVDLTRCFGKNRCYLVVIKSWLPTLFDRIKHQETHSLPRMNRGTRTAHQEAIRA